jgi:hypothetical protein
MARFIDTLMQRGQSMQESLDRQLEERRIQREAEAAKIKAKRDAELANSRTYRDWASGKKPGAELIDGTLYPKSISTPTKKREQSRMSSDANIDKDRIGKGSFEARPSDKRNKTSPNTPKRNNEIDTYDPLKETYGPLTPPRSTVQYNDGTLNPSEFGPATMGPGVGVERGNVTSQGATRNYEAEFPVETFNPGKTDRVQFEDESAKPFWNRFKKGGQVKKKTAKKASGGSVSSASKRGDGCCQRGKTKGRMV